MIDDHPSPDPFAQRILTRIDEEHVTQRSRWTFIFKNYFFWTIGVLAVVLGAFAFAATIFHIENAGWRYYIATNPYFFSLFLQTVPFLWVLALVLFTLIGYVNIRRTHYGYRYPLTIIVFGSILTSMTLGVGLYAAGLGNNIENFIGDHPPFFRPIFIEQHSLWLRPNEGLLGGQITSVTPDITSFTLRDFSGKTWIIDGTDLRGIDLAVVARGGEVRVVGVPATTTIQVFHACFVFPWETHGTFGQLLPMPLAIIASSSEMSTTMRSELCKDIRPYQQLRDLDE